MIFLDTASSGVLLLATLESNNVLSHRAVRGSCQRHDAPGP